MRFVLGLLIGLGFLAGGVYAFAGVLSMLARGMGGEDILAAGFIGAMLGAIGVAVIWGAIRTRRLRARADIAQAGLAAQAMIVATDTFDDLADGSD